MQPLPRYNMSKPASPFRRANCSGQSNMARSRRPPQSYVQGHPSFGVASRLELRKVTQKVPRRLTLGPNGLLQTRSLAGGRKFVRLVGILSHSSVGGKGLAPGYLNKERALQGCEQEIRPTDAGGAPRRLFNVEKTWAEAERDPLTAKLWRSSNVARPNQETLILHFFGHGTTTLEFEMPGGQRSIANPRFGAQLSRIIFKPARVRRPQRLPVDQRRPRAVSFLSARVGGASSDRCLEHRRGRRDVPGVC